MPKTKFINQKQPFENMPVFMAAAQMSKVCGVSKYKSPVELWQEKTGQVKPAEAGEAAYWGRTLESVVGAEFTKRTGVEVSMPNKLPQSKEYPFMLANLDGICTSNEGYCTCVFEAKTANAFRADEWDDAVPEEYVLQRQHYLAVTGFAGAYIAVLIGGNTFKWDFLERDEDFIAKIIKWESDFWEHVKLDIPPPLDDSKASAEYLKNRFPNSVARSTVKLPDEALELIRLYDEAKGMSEAIYGGGTVNIEMKDRHVYAYSRVKQYRKELSHDGIYAEATLMVQDDEQSIDDNATADFCEVDFTATPAEAA